MMGHGYYGRESELAKCVYALLERAGRCEVRDVVEDLRRGVRHAGYLNAGTELAVCFRV